MSTPRRHRSNLPARAELCQYPAMSRLILFDIDGTGRVLEPKDAKLFNAPS